MIQLNPPTTTDATNSTTADDMAIMTWTVVEAVTAWPDDDERDYETFLEGWRFRFDHWHMHPWHGQLPRLQPGAVAERSRRRFSHGTPTWPSGFK